jgi:hypothetical protein
MKFQKAMKKIKRILELEQEISKNSFDDLQLLKESKILIPKLNSLRFLIIILLKEIVWLLRQFYL